MDNNKKNYFLPVSILIAAVLISGALIYNVGSNSEGSNGKGANVAENIPSTPSAKNVKPVDENDWIRGNPDAPIKFVEFSDLECPYCKKFHPTMQQVVEEYPDKVAWVYRHFPLDNLHSKARAEANAAECAGELGGNQGFWDFINKVYEITPSNNGLDLNTIPQIVGEIGLDTKAFKQCLEEDRHADKVEEDLQNATASGGRGTPYSVIIVNDGEQYVPVNGALPYNTIKQVIDTILSEN